MTVEMVKVIRGKNCSIAWLNACVYLSRKPNNEKFYLCVEIDNPIEIDGEIHQKFGEFFKRHFGETLEKRAEDIFPSSLYNGDAKLLYKKVRKQTYFEKLINYKDREANAEPFNQIEYLILRFSKIPRHRRDKAYESSKDYTLQVLNPKNEYTSLLNIEKPKAGLSCLSSIDFKQFNNRINLFAEYRNHYFIRKAYSNYYGLGRLLEFVVGEINKRRGTKKFDIGKLIVFSTHAELDRKKYKKEFLKLLSSFEAQYRVHN